ncbi:MAG TPA: hypothetical protein PLN63_03390 [Paludibacteraceae bacterium]|nr:hypothetical protein [Paludibacteraceae bacterium]
MEDEFYIPVDSSIESFLHHINSHDRTILSAKYGDGKTYFLSKFMQSEEVRKEYEFITLYPINYQILENRDIIDVIKFDILMQMFAKGMIDKNADYISDNVALGFFIRSNSLSIFESLLAMISCLGLMPETQQTVLVSITGIKVFKDLKKKYEEFRICFEFI